MKDYLIKTWQEAHRLGFLSGMCVGLFLNAFFVAGPFGDDALMFLFLGAPFTVIVFLSIPIIGGAMGNNFAKEYKLPTVHKGYLLMIALVLLPASCLAPFQIQKTMMHSEWAKAGISTLPETTVLKSTYGRMDNYKSIEVQYKIDANINEVRTFYEQNLLQNGWQILGDNYKGGFKPFYQVNGMFEGYKSTLVKGTHYLDLELSADIQLNGASRTDEELSETTTWAYLNLTWR